MNKKASNNYIYLILMGILTAAIAVFIFSMCYTGKNSNANVEDVVNAVMPYMDTDKVQAGDNNMIQKLYGLDLSEFEGATLYYPVTNMDADELFIIKLKDSSQQKEVEDAINSRLATQLASFDGYGDEQTAMLNASHIYVSGNYAIFISGNQADAGLAAFKKAL